MLNFTEFQKQIDESHDIVAGLPDHVANVHKSIIRQNGGVIHHHSTENGIHKVIFSTKSGATKVSEIHPSSEKNKTSSIITRRATDKEKKANSGHFIASE